MGDEIRHLPILGMPPALLDDVEFRRIGGQEFHMDAWAIDVFEQARSFLLSTEAIPDEQQRALEMPTELLDKGKDIVARDIGGGHREIEVQALVHWRDGDRTSHREAIIAVLTIMDGRLALRCPCAPYRGLDHEATLVNEDYGAALTPGFF
jgi:hypothetical protein